MRRLAGSLLLLLLGLGWAWGKTTCDFADTTSHTTPLWLHNNALAYNCANVDYDITCATYADTPTTGWTELRSLFHDSEAGNDWKFWWKATNTHPSNNKTVQLTATINGDTCNGGPWTLGPGGFVTITCAISEPTNYGYYILVAQSANDNYLKYNFLLCQKN